MKRAYGVEMQQPTASKTPGYFSRLVKKSIEIASIIDRDRRLSIVLTKDDQEQLANYYESKGIFEEAFELLFLENHEKMPSFLDYGFTSDSELDYLYADLVACFIMTDDTDSEHKNMALIQMKEHLIAIEKLEQPIYVVDIQFKPLIDKIAAAYEVAMMWIDF